MVNEGAGHVCLRGGPVRATGHPMDLDWGRLAAQRLRSKPGAVAMQSAVAYTILEPIFPRLGFVLACNNTDWNM